MDASESDRVFVKNLAQDPREPLSPAERNNAVSTINCSRPREVSSRYKSPTPSAVSARRCISPSVSRTAMTSSQLVQKRSLSTERKRPSSPSSPVHPSTPVSDSVDIKIASRKAVTSRLGESLWPSTMRSLSVSFQSDSISVPIMKKEKPASTPSDRTLRPSSNVAHKQVELPVARKPVSERNKSPLRGKNISDQSENSKPADVVVHTRLIDQHRWPSRIGGKVSSSALNRSMDIGDKAIRTPTPMSVIGLSTVRRLPSSDGLAKPLQKTTSDAERLMKQERSYKRGTSPVPSEDSYRSYRRGTSPVPSDNSYRRGTSPVPSDDSFRSYKRGTSPVPSNDSYKRGTSPVPSDDSFRSYKRGTSPVPSNDSYRSYRRGTSPVPSSDGLAKSLQKTTSDAERLMKHNRCYKRGTSPVPSDDSSVSSSNKADSTSLLEQMRPLTPSARYQSLPIPASRLPSPIQIPSPSVSRGVSPVRARPSSPSPRGLSPSRARPSSPTNQTSNTSSVLSFIVDVRKGKRTAGYIEDAHQLRLLYNRHIQWRFANAWAEAVLCDQKVTAENTLNDVWVTMFDLWNSVTENRMTLQQLRLELKLNSVLNSQMGCLDGWALLEREHTASLLGALEDLEASTLRLPATAGARAEIDTLKRAIGSAVHVMQVTETSVQPLLSKVEKMNTMISELAIVSALERAMLDECEALLASTEAMQVREHSLRTHILQVKQDLEDGSSQFWQSVMPP